MKHSRLILGLAAACWALWASPGMAQFWPGASFYGGAWGGYPASQYNTTREIAAQNQQLGQEAAIGQNVAMQSGIRNTLSSQAQSRTDAIQSQRQPDVPEITIKRQVVAKEAAGTAEAKKPPRVLP